MKSKNLLITVILVTTFQPLRCSHKSALAVYTLASDPEPVVIWKEDILNANRPIQAARIIGGHAWQIEEDDGVKTLHFITSTSKTYLGNVLVKSSKVMSDCNGRSYVRTLPNSAFTGSAKTHGHQWHDARPLGLGFIGYLPNAWLAIDMGVQFALYRIWAQSGYISQVGGRSCTTYSLYYRRENEDFKPYTENDVTKVFDNIGWPFYTFSPPIISQIFKFVPLTGINTEIGLVAHLYGCALNYNIENTTSTMIKIAGNYDIQKISVVDDQVDTTCFIVPAATSALFMKYVINDNSSSTASIRLKSSVGNECSSMSSVTAYTGIQPALEQTLSGQFYKCPDVNIYEEAELTVHDFSCSCPYAVCDFLYLRVISLECPMQICSIDTYVN